ncbi:hypothetical protein Mgra_00001697 [Meloidogyne graminicola]|uniref:VPS9 domain-containing protein n=1 Tax=Meloidogyne graminicola TaxID=189291 RepID=A0A8T0A053_9BILA|nr:hypothetical protein Mgra_00001697 [Meloidogyne graminicola]
MLIVIMMILSKSTRQPSSILSVDHPDLAIPKCLHAECPWSSAQVELNIINAYKSPRDKMNCISRCCETIENLTVLFAGRLISCADDILPILVFVLIVFMPVEYKVVKLIGGLNLIQQLNF